MQNKIFDLDNYTERDYTPEFFSLSKLPYAYDPKATCPKWDKALDDYFKTDPDQVLQLDELMGYALVPGNPWELIAALCGASRGGKGLTAEIFGGLLGKENICAIGTDKLGSPFALYGAFGKLLIRVPDVPITGLTPCMTGMMNDIVGGETLNIEGKNSNAFFDVLTGKILLTSNFLRYCDPTNSFNNRLRVVRYTKSYLVKGERGYVQGQDQDAGLKSYIITNELPGIFNRALAGLKRFRTNKKFTEPASSRRLKDNMLAQGSPVTLFVEDALILKEGTQELCSDTFTVYGKWCVKMGYGKEIYDIQSTFGGLLQACCPSVERVRESTDGNRKYYYTGIEIKTEFKPEFKGT
jgi:putative DNA primase/helicase